MVAAATAEARNALVAALLSTFTGIVQEAVGEASHGVSSDGILSPFSICEEVAEA